MSATTAERIINLLDEIRPLVAKLDPLLRELEDLNPYDGISVNRLELSVRAANALKEAGVKTVGDVRAMTDAQLMRIPNCGYKSIAEIRKAVKNHSWADPP